MALRQLLGRALRAGIVTVLAACGGACSVDVASPETPRVDEATAALTTSDVVGTWELWTNNFHCPVTVTASGQTLSATMHCDQFPVEPLDNVAISGGFLEFRRVTNSATLFQWFRLRVNQGVGAGRFSSLATPSKPPLNQFYYHLTGWNQAAFPTNAGPLAFELHYPCNCGSIWSKLRIDGTPGHYQGRFKTFWQGAIPGSPAGEMLEEDIAVNWNGSEASPLTFSRGVNGVLQTHSAMISGRTMIDTVVTGGAAPVTWTGTRADLLGYGFLGGKGTVAHQAWITKTRSRLQTLMMAGNPTPTGPAPTAVSVATDIWDGPEYYRDDDFTFPMTPAYSVKELTFQRTITSPFDGTSQITRPIHAYVTHPVTGGPKYPAVLILNGHGGSAHQALAPSSLFWYGDSFARQGYIVLAVDISHRGSTQPPPPGTVTPADRMYGYGDYQNGDLAWDGNGIHPPIQAAGYDTDWEENGERIWDAMRGVDYLQTLTEVDTTKILVAGLSMGGELTLWTAALDGRLTGAAPFGWDADLDALLGAPVDGHRCGAWRWGHIEEYIDTSDLVAMVAPRPMVLGFGQHDTGVSMLTPPYATSKQLARRGRVAYSEYSLENKFIHELYINTQPGVDEGINHHEFHVGKHVASAPGATPVGVLETNAYTPAQSATWQTDGAVHQAATDLFHVF